MLNPLITNSAGVLSVLCGVCALFFFLEQRTQWRLFRYFPPLIFIYLVPVLLSAGRIIPTDAPVYEAMRSLLLPMLLVLLLLKVDVGSAIRVLGKGIFVMLFGTLGVVLGAPVAFLLVRGCLGPEGWKAFGTLAGSWIGGTGNMAAVKEMIDTGGTEFGLAVLGDTTIYIIWLPILLASKRFADHFGRFTNASPDRTATLNRAADALDRDDRVPRLQDYLYLLFIGLSVAWVADMGASRLPDWEPYVSTGTWRILLITTIGIGLSFTPPRRVPGSHNLAMAMLYLFVARMGASAELAGIASQAIPFLLAAMAWIVIHGAFCVLGAWLFRIDMHTAAIASAANIGGVASAPIVAAHHKESLVPASILMALLGYAIGNYAAWVAAQLCRVAASL